MVQSSRVSEQEKLISEALIQQEIPLQQDPASRRDTTNSNFRETNLLVVEKKKKFVPQKEEFNADEGVLSIPPEDAPNNCKKCCWCLCCLPYYMLCCCLCWKEKEFSARKPDFIKRFTKWLPNRQNDIERADANVDPIPVLIQLYSCEPQAVEELSKCRINPDLTSPVRQDLEFYIPQLISFYLQGYYPNMEQLIDLIVQACKNDFYFSHRIFFQLKSVTFESLNDVQKEEEQRQAIDNVLKNIYEMISASIKQDVALDALAQENYIERLFLPNSRDLIRLLVNFNMVGFHPQLKSDPYASQLLAKGGSGLLNAVNNMNQKQIKASSGQKLARKISQWQEKRLRNVQLVFDEYNTKGWNQQDTLKQINASINDNVSEDSSGALEVGQMERFKDDYKDSKITAKDIFLPPFKDDLTDQQLETARLDYVTQAIIEEQSITENSASDSRASLAIKKATQSIYDSYLSTPTFIKRLCDISDGLIGLSPTDKKTYLMQELQKVNKQLPAACYIPFVNQSMRNYAVLHIVAEESRIFKTKERCPLLLCIEVYRPTEIALETIPDALTLQREIMNSSPGVTGDISEIQSELQASNDKREAEAFQQSRRQKKGMRSSTMVQSDVQPAFPFGGIEEENKSIVGKEKAVRNSFAGSNRDSDTDSFISAPDSPTAIQNMQQQEKLRLKKQKEAKKKFSEIKKMKNKDKVGQEFGNLADQRASDPVTLQMLKLRRSGMLELTQSRVDRTNTLKKINENYFQQSQFAHTPTTTQPPVQLASLEEIKQEHDQDGNRLPEAFNATRATRASFKSSGSHGRSRSQVPQQMTTGPISEPRQALAEPEVQLLDTSQGFEEEAAYMKKASGMGQTRGMSIISSDEENAMPSKAQNEESQLLRPSQSPSADLVNTTSGGKVDFFNDRDYYKIFLETSKEQEARIKANSPFKALKTWNLLRVIFKTNDDLRQEAFAMQLISQCDQIFRKAKLPLWLKPYEIIACGPHCGLIEVVSDALSVSSIKEKTEGANATIVDYFRSQYGKPSSKKYQQAVENFTNSLCAYSLVCYILQIKDRHNENILIDIEGHVLHIDFGFLLSNAPGKGIKFEKAPFKLTQEMLDVMGGENSDKFRDFRMRMARGFVALQANAEKIIILVEMMLMGQSDLPCFQGGKALIRELKFRLFPNGRRLKFEEAFRHVDGLIGESVNNWRTRCYDRAQYCMQGIL